MVASQRSALFNGAVCAAAAICFLALVPVIGPSRATGALGLLGLTALSPLFFRRRSSTVVSDERDRSIALRAMQISFAVAWLAFVSAAMSVFYLKHGQGVIPVNALPLSIAVAWVILILSHSISTLVLYKRS